MSNFYASAINPATCKTEQAEYLDDFYGKHRFGVKFLDGQIYPENLVTRVIDQYPPVNGCKRACKSPRYTDSIWCRRCGHEKDCHGEAE